MIHRKVLSCAAAALIAASLPAAAQMPDRPLVFAIDGLAAAQGSADIDGGGSFSANRLSGRAACNRMHATLTRGDGSLRIGPIATTRMGCSKGMDLEARLVASLATVEKTAVVEGRCVLRDGTGRDRVTFVRAGQ